MAILRNDMSGLQFDRCGGSNERVGGPRLFERRSPRRQSRFSKHLSQSKGKVRQTMVGKNVTMAACEHMWFKRSEMAMCCLPSPHFNPEKTKTLLGPRVDDHRFTKDFQTESWIASFKIHQILLSSHPKASPSPHRHRHRPFLHERSASADSAFKSRPYTAMASRSSGNFCCKTSSHCSRPFLGKLLASRLERNKDATNGALLASLRTEHPYD